MLELLGVSTMLVQFCAFPHTHALGICGCKNVEGNAVVNNYPYIVNEGMLPALTWLQPGDVAQSSQSRAERVWKEGSDYIY